MNLNSSWSCRLGALAFICCGTYCLAYGQDVDSGWIKNETYATAKNQIGNSDVSASHNSSRYRALASSLLRNFEFVADGEFLGLPDSSPEELRTLFRENVLVEFRIHELHIHQGIAQDSAIIELPNDMLVVQGEGISRYAKRQMIIDKQIEDLRHVLEQTQVLDRSLRAGEIDRQEYSEQQDKLLNIVEERVAQDGVLEYVAQDGVIEYFPWIPVLHANSFYDYGGVIRSGERYLIGANRIPKGADVYALDEYFYSSRIYWGEMREAVRLALNELMP